MMHKLSLLGAIMLSALTLGMPTRVFANCSTWTAVSSCPATCNSNCRLTTNVTCANGQGITLNSGVNLDMCGSDILCSTSLCDFKPAVTMTANGSQVVNNGASESVINSFALGVDCQHTGSIVNGIFFENDTTGTKDCSKVQNDVFNNSTGALYTGGTGLATDEFSDNDVNSVGKQVEINNRTTALKIDHNLFQMGSGAASVKGIAVTSSSNITATDNIFMGLGTPISVSSSSITTDQNYCDPNDPTDFFGDMDGLNNNCLACRSAAYCNTPHTPFTLP